MAWSQKFRLTPAFSRLDRLLPIGCRAKTGPATPTNLRKITLSIEAACTVQSRGPQYYLSVGPVTKEITFNSGAYYTQYLISDVIECSNSWIYWVLRRCPRMSPLERRNWGHAPDLPAWRHPFRPFFSHQRFLSIWFDAPLKTFCTRHWMGPRKSASNRAPHLLRPALPVR